MQITTNSLPDMAARNAGTVVKKDPTNDRCWVELVHGGTLVLLYCCYVNDCRGHGPKSLVTRFCAMCKLGVGSVPSDKATNKMRGVWHVLLLCQGSS